MFHSYKEMAVKYKQGSLGRVFVLKFEDKDDILEEVKKIVCQEAIKVGTIMLVGGMRSAEMVSGPKEPVVPPESLWVNFNDGRDMLGIGTIFWKDNEPVIHIHGAMGHEKDILTGCLRKNNFVFIGIEAIITEILAVDARKALNEKTGLIMLEL